MIKQPVPMLYFFLFILFLLFFIYSLTLDKENRTIALVMGIVLFLLVALRRDDVGPDTLGYIQQFLDPYHKSLFGREEESLYRWWVTFWSELNLNSQSYLFVCAIASVGFVLLCMWQLSKNRVWTYTFFLVVFSWYFYLTGIRQSLSMGCFTVGTYFLSRNLDSISLKSIFFLFRWENLSALVFLVLSPMFHSTALFADTVLLLALLSPPKGRWLYISSIIVSFIICLTATFRDAEEILQYMFNYVSKDVEILYRYSGYVELDYLYDTSLYLILKSALPINFIALFSFTICKKDYDLQERLFFWLVLVNNLFFYFSYLFRLKMFLYPAAAIAIANMLWPILQRKRYLCYRIILVLFVVLCAYTSYINLIKQPEFDYKFFLPSMF